ncbi:MAG: hypothetical protein GW903_09300 [Alphaproteobacteria bacterium]|nr:hypothetical protein [Alphaproteobacteria bacterium]NCQ89055.1 hypothetical protein [Alphaproteobacteria bacterium]NCT07955.1 hypothetical protein [Alphaproteobacteria bacterium]
MKTQNIQNGNALFPSSLRGAFTTRQSFSTTNRLLRFARNDRATENGNALWFILIAIILLGLLTAMMTRSGGNTNDTGDYERNSIIANEILGYARNIENAVQSLLARGCGENDIRFESTGDCSVFSPAGTGLTALSSSEEGWIISDTTAWPHGIRFEAMTNGAPNVGPNGHTNGSGSNLNIFIPNIKEEYCVAINRLVGVENPEGYPPRDITSSAIEGGGFNGSYGGASCCTFDTSGGETDAKPTACFVSNDHAGASNALDGQDRFYFYHTLIAR